MRTTQYLPTLLIAIDIGAAVVWGITEQNWRQVIYWLAAAALTASVTY